MAYDKCVEIIKAAGFTPEEDTEEGNRYSVNITGTKPTGETLWLRTAAYGLHNKIEIRAGFEQGEYKLQGRDEYLKPIFVSTSRDVQAIVRDINRRLLPFLPDKIAQAKNRIDSANTARINHEKVMQNAANLLGIKLEVQEDRRPTIHEYFHDESLEKIEVESFNDEYEISVRIKIADATEVLQVLGKLLKKKK